jgi:hypothetical protein
MIPISEQLEVIKKYEIGMSKYFRGLGVNLEVLYKRTLHNQVLAACRAISDDYCNFKLNDDTLKSEIFNLPLNLGYAINPTHILWDDILEKYDWIKVKTLDRTNKDFRVYKLIKYLETNIENLEGSLNILSSRRLDGILSK